MESTGKLAGPALVIYLLLDWANKRWTLGLPIEVLSAAAGLVGYLVLRRLNRAKATADAAHEIASQ